MADPIGVLVVDDDPDVRAYLGDFLSAHGYRVQAAGDGEGALRALTEGATRPAVVLLDLRMPGIDGFEVLRRYREAGGDTPIIALSGLGETETVVRAMRLGASDYLAKPFEIDQLKDALVRALRRPEPVPEPDAPAPRARHRAAPADHVTASVAMERVWEMVERVAHTDVPVLIRGESGVGKEVVARQLHARSPRSARPFIKVNCAALPAELLESELFGHERGAFTGATSEKPGKFELANTGTIFLDEIGEMHPSLQAKMLQVLQDEEFYRVGGKRPVRVDARVITATNRELEQEIQRGNFREDLYYRLNVVSIPVAPLRERRDDIPLLVEHFLKKYGARYSNGGFKVPDEVMRLFLEHGWPGNVRELENMVRRLVVLRDASFVMEELAGRRQAGATISTAMGPGASRGAPPLRQESAPPSPQPQQPPPPLEVVPMFTSEPSDLKAIARHAAMLAERQAIHYTLLRTNWNKRKAAALLHISYKALLYKIKECGIVDPRDAASAAAAPRPTGVPGVLANG